MSQRRPRILITFYWYVEALHRGVIRYCREKGWDTTTDIASARRSQDEPFDAVIGMLPPDPEHPTRKRVAAAGVPVVEMSLAYPENKAWCRYPEACETAGRLAAQHLRRLPVVSFACFDDTPWWNHDRKFAAFRNELSGDERPVFHHHLRVPGVWTNTPVAEYLAALPKPCGIFGAVDGFARTVVDIACEAGFSVPGDFFVMGFGDTDIHSGGPSVPLTTIGLDREAWAYAAAGMLDDLMAGRVNPGEVREFPPGKLIVRESTGGGAGGDPLCERSLAIMREHIEKPLTVPKLAAKVGVSASSLERAFAGSIGGTVARRYLELRMDVAKGLLSSGEKAESVAGAVGFASYRAFALAFKKSTGKAPGEYAGKRRNKAVK